MKEKHPVKGSNTLYKVWGIIVLVFAAIAGILDLLSIILMFKASSGVGSLPLGIGNNASGKIAAYTVVVMIISVLALIIQISAGILLVRDYIKSTGIFVALSVYYFLGAVLLIIVMIGSIVLKSVSGVLICLIFAAWNIATGIMLISKSGKADMSGTISGAAHEERSPEIAVHPLVQGRIEGVFGGFQGKQISLNPGQVCKIGREAGCDIQLEHPKVSRIHCTVCMAPDGRYQITDYSYNGTFYENKRLSKNIMEEVEPGGMLVIGEADNVLLLG